MSEHTMGRRKYGHYFFFFHETMFYISIMQSDNTVVSIAAVFFFKKAAIIIATHGQKRLHWQLSKVIILSGIYNCSFEAIN